MKSARASCSAPRSQRLEVCTCLAGTHLMKSACVFFQTCSALLPALLRTRRNRLRNPPLAARAVLRKRRPAEPQQAATIRAAKMRFVMLVFAGVVAGCSARSGFEECTPDKSTDFIKCVGKPSALTPDGTFCNKLYNRNRDFECNLLFKCVNEKERLASLVVSAPEDLCTDAKYNAEAKTFETSCPAFFRSEEPSSITTVRDRDCARVPTQAPTLRTRAPSPSAGNANGFTSAGNASGLSAAVVLGLAITLLGLDR